MIPINVLAQLIDVFIILVDGSNTENNNLGRELMSGLGLFRGTVPTMTVGNKIFRTVTMVY
jgi:hypothetical protein